MAAESTPREPGDREPEWVIRGGIVTLEQLTNGARPISGARDLCEISVAFQPGRTVEELAAFSRFPNAQISVTTRETLLAAGTIEVRQTPGRNPVHGDIIVPCSTEGTVDPDLLAALARVFTQRPNPARGPRQ